MTDLESGNIYRVHWSKEKRVLIESQSGRFYFTIPRHPKGWKESNLNRLKIPILLAEPLCGRAGTLRFGCLLESAGELQKSAYAQAAPRPIKLEYPSGKSRHKGFLNLPDDSSMQPRLKYLPNSPDYENHLEHLLPMHISRFQFLRRSLRSCVPQLYT